VRLFLCRPGLLLLVIVLLAGCGGRAHPPAGAGNTGGERVVNVYNWFDYIDPGVIADFEKEYGLHVNYDVFDSDEILEAKLFAGNTGYDLVMPSPAVFERGLAGEVFAPLDRRQLSNFGNLDPEVKRFLQIYDPGNRYATVYTWLNSVGIAYDRRKVHSRLPDAPTDSLRMVFDPSVVAHFQDCGVAFIDSSVDVVGMALIYLGKDPNSEDLADLKAAGNVLQAVRKYLRYVDTGRYVSDLANGDICVALGWSGDVVQSRDRAREAGLPVDLTFAIPREGSLNGADFVTILADAPHPANAHLFLNYLLRPEVAARITNRVGFANGVAAATPLVRASLRDDPSVYPPPAVRSQLFAERAKSAAFTRPLMRLWTRFKTMT
jgi:putrescine transport system substrate-binding protein